MVVYIYSPRGRSLRLQSVNQKIILSRTGNINEHASD